MDPKEVAGKISFRVENIQPILSVKDMQISRSFYKETLGFEEAGWGTGAFTSVNWENAGIYLCKGAQGYPGTWLWIGFDGNIIKLHDELKAKRVKIKMPPTNFSWVYEMHVEDPDGHVLRFGTDPDNTKPFEDIEG